MKRLLKRLLWESGLFSFWHRQRNRRSLTIAQFHRVLPAGSEELAASERTYALSIEDFDVCLDFFSRHYAVVSLEDVIAAQARKAKLPDRALLISFDDGWRDNLVYAQPVLQRYGMPATLFVNVEALQQQDSRWWQDALVEVYLGGRVHEVLPELPQHANLHDAILMLLTVPLEARLQMLLPALRYEPRQRQMLLPTDLAGLDPQTWQIGSHGCTHAPLDRVANPAAEIEGSAQTVSAWIGRKVESIGFPHGRYSPEVLRTCRLAGIPVVMSSDTVLNDADALPDVLGRINIDQDMLVMQADKGMSLAWGLWTRAWRTKSAD